MQDDKSRKNFYTTSSLRGFTLTEIAIVTAIAGIVLGGVWVAASTVRENNRVRHGVDQVQQVINGYQTIFSGRVPNASGIQNALGVSAGVFPKELFEQNHPVSPWGSPVYVVTYAGVNEILFTYGIDGLGGTDGLTTSACIRMADALTFQPGVIYEEINAQTNPSPLTDTSVYTPWTTDQIQQYCSHDAASGNQLQVAYRAR